MTNPLPTAEELLGTFNRPMPFSDEAEKGVLSCLLQDPNRIAANLHTMPPGLFQHPAHREIFVLLVDEAIEGKPLTL